MKKIVLLFLLLISYYCTRNSYEIERLKYSKDDLIQLSDSTKKLYYSDAAFIEFNNIIQDSLKRYEHVELKNENILSYYGDLLNIYNNSYNISNSFFEHVTSIHTYSANTLYQIYVSVDKNKTWADQWKNGIINIGISKIDTLISNYNLNIIFIDEMTGGYFFKFISKVPINYFALIDKFSKTGEFRYVEPEVLVGGGSYILLIDENKYKLYKFSLGWGDCPSGCIHYHHWIIKVDNQKISLFEEKGDPL